MKLHTKIQLLKFCSVLLNLIFAALGLSVAGCGVWILFDGSFISVASSASDSLRVVAVSLLAVGGLVLLVGVLGSVGVQRESRVLLLSVGVVLVLLVLAQIFITFLMFLSRVQMERKTMEAVTDLILKYPTEKPHLLDNLQHYAECCGQMNSSDWQNNQFVQSLNMSEGEILPCSCFKLNRHGSGTFCSENQTLISDIILYGNSSYSQGCDAALKNWLSENLFTIVGMNIGLVLIQVLELVLVVTLYRSFGAKSSVKSSEPDIGQDHDYSDQDQISEDQDQAYHDQDQVYSDQELLHQELDQEPYHGPYDGPYGEVYDGHYQDPDQDYR